jgi:probable F420-dependent oxidoreductase
MKFGVHLTHYRPAGGHEPAIENAMQAEELGLYSVWAGDHILSPERLNSVYPYAAPGTVRTAQAEGGMPDPFILLGMIGARTSRIRLGLNVLVVGYRPALLTAKSIATLDALNQGRVSVGIGSGWLKEEFEALGVPYGERGKRLEEHVDVWRRVWTGENVAFDGQFTKFERLRVLPKPVRPEGPPIYVGGDSPVAVRRAAEMGDGWIPINLPPAKYRELLGTIRNRSAAFGRPAPAAALSRRFDIVDTTPPEGDTSNPYRPFVGTPDDVIRHIRDYEAAGVEEIVISGAGSGTDELAKLLDRFGKDVLPAFKA